MYYMYPHNGFPSVFLTMWYIFMFFFTNAALAVAMIGSWFTYRKMGLPGWKGIIPGYNLYVLFEELWETKQFWRMIIYLGVYVVGCLFGSGFIALGGVFYTDGRYTGPGLVFLLVGIGMMIASLVLLVLAIVKEYQIFRRMTRSFGLRAGWIWGLIFVPYILLPIIGFHKNIVYLQPVKEEED